MNLTQPELAEERAMILRALGNPVRLRIIACLADDGEQTVGALGQTLNLPQSSVSRQLSWLRLHELVEARNQGGFHYYTIAMPQLTVLLDCLKQCCRHTDTAQSTGSDKVD
jgi:ArsR family transcriptional regulator